MLELMYGQNLGQFGEGRLGIGQPGSHLPILDEGKGRKHEGMPALDRFVGLQPIIGQPEAFLEIPAVDLRLPTTAILLQDRLNTQRGIRTQEVSGMRIWPGPFGNDRYHRFGIVAQPTGHTARGVGAAQLAITPAVVEAVAQKGAGFSDPNSSIRL
jgi:hypothetical protein